MHTPRFAGTFLFLASCLTAATITGAEIELLDRPLWVFPGQTFRIALKQPAGSGELDATRPPGVELFDTWRKDSIQRFYFRALEPGDVTLTFSGKAGSLEVPLEVIPWSDVYTARKFKGIDLPRIWPVGEPDYRELKRRRTFHDDRHPVTVRKPSAKISALARRWAEMPDEDVFNIVPGPCVPRTCLIVLSGGSREDGRGKGCPVCGMKVYEGRSGFYPWVFDAENHPWKVGCPSCDTWFPSNDWHLGDMHSGPFPDDGFGCEPLRPVMAPNGVPWRWPFVAYYHQWTAYMNTLTPGIEQSARAFAETGDLRYAHKAAVGLFRYAESMLDMSMNMNHRKMAVRDAILRWPVGAPSPRNGLSGTFLYIQPNWDTPRMERLAQAWDLIFDALDDDQKLLTFCRSQHHPEIETNVDFRRFIEAGVIRVPLQACLDNAVARNYPMQEVAVATMALVMGSPRSLDLADWLLNDGAAMRMALTNEFFKDGSAPESESYNSIHIRDIERIFDLLERIRRLDPAAWARRGLVSPYDDPKYRLIYDFPLGNTLIGRTTTWTGDTGHAITTDPRPLGQTFPLSVDDYVGVYRRTRDPRFAQVLFGPLGKIPSTLDEPELRAEVERIGQDRGWLVNEKSDVLDGYGHAILRSGSGDHARAFWLRYGRVVQHAHQDLLTMGLAAVRRDMLPELGYPQGWTHTSHWAANWGTHYGTHITGIRTRDFGRGRLTLFADAAPARVAKAVSHLSGKQEVLRSRTIVLVDLSQQDCYAVTLERVLGGTEHTMSFHGPPGTVTSEGLELLEQRGGTVLGEDVPYGKYDTVRGNDPELACLAFMDDVRRADPDGVWSLDYELEHQEGVHLHVTTIGPEGCKLALARGKPPQGKKSYEMTWSILRRFGTAPLASSFVTVLEPLEGRRVVRRVEPLVLLGASTGPLEPVGIRVTSDDYVDTILFQAEDTDTCTTSDGVALCGEFGFWREQNGKPVAAHLAAGTSLGRGDARVSLPRAAWKGHIVRCDWKNRTVVVEPSLENPARFVGRHVRIGNPAGSSASYLIEKAEATEDGCRITLPLDPRVGEGFVGACAEGVVLSATRLRLHSQWHYYAGKTIANEDASARYRLSDVHDSVRCLIDESIHGKVDAERLQTEFTDRDGDGRARFLIYDYGPGDEVTCKESVSRSWSK